MAEKAHIVKAYFDSIARRYDLMNTLLSFGLHFSWKRSAIKAAGLRPGQRILDVCGGTGDLAVRAARCAGSSPRVVLYDFSLAMMRAGKSKQNRAGYAAFTCLCGDARQIALRDNTFDAVLIGFGLRNLSDMPAGLKEMYRVLRPGGTFLCLEFSRPQNSLFRRLYDIYSLYGIPAAGKLIAGSRDAYTYLPQSIRQFPGPEALVAMMERAGFTEAAFTLLCNGVAAIHRGIKKHGHAAGGGKGCGV